MLNIDSDENGLKWKETLITALQKVQKQVHTSVILKQDALEYVEKLIIRLLYMLCTCQPHTVSDIEEHVRKTLPSAVAKWAIADAQAALEKGKKKSPLVLPVDKLHVIIKERVGYKIDNNVSLYIVAVLEYISADILKLASNYVRKMKNAEISCQDIQIAMCADNVLMDMFYPGEDDGFKPVAEPVVRRESIKYEDVVKDLIIEENQYLRDLKMIIMVFRAPFAKSFPRSENVEAIFSNVQDLYEFTVNLVTSIEDQIEATAQREHLHIGTCFAERIEGAEFEIYEQYIGDILKPIGVQKLNELLQNEELNNALKEVGPGFILAVKYVLPKLLLGPIYHFFHYFEVLEILFETSPSDEDKENLDQTKVSLNPIKALIERQKELGNNLPKQRPWESSLRLHNRISGPAAMARLSELQKSIDGWVGKDICQSCSEFILEGPLNKLSNRRLMERHVILLDSLLIICKQNVKRQSVTTVAQEYKLKEKYMIRKLEIVDKDDCEEYSNAFELRVRDSPSIVLSARSLVDKSSWMAALVSLQTRGMLERQLDIYIKIEEKATPLRLPDPTVYRFAEEDSEENIVCEENPDTGECSVIKGGTLLKLIERLTYHRWSDPRFSTTFLTTYRSFCSPHELLDLLIIRYNIPEPPPLQADGIDPEELEVAIRDDLKRFRKEYMKPIQFRVLNVMRHWVDQHFYDFERDFELLYKLQIFLENVKGKAMKTCSIPITRILNRRQESPKVGGREFTYNQEFPPIEWHMTLNNEYDNFDLMTLHPVEIARQVTLLEFDMYCAVRPSELVGCPWIKRNKQLNSPNLLKMIHFSTMFTFWLEKCIIESENFEERVAVTARILEVMMVFQELNNFNGVLEIVSALNSAPVYRLENTFHEQNSKLMKAFEEAKELNADHFKKYIEKLRSINPPCVPFLGHYLTNILLNEEGNPDFLSNRKPELINFSKRRRLAEFTGEIEQYQNQRYCYRVENLLRRFFESLDPMEGRTEKEFNDYLYTKSLEIEPRGCKQLPKFAAKRLYSLRSPGIRLNRSSKLQHAYSHSSLTSAPSMTSIVSNDSRSTDVRHFNFGRIDETVETCSSPTNTATPPTPSTPLLSPDPITTFQPVSLPQPVSESFPLCYSTEPLVAITVPPIAVTVPPVKSTVINHVDILNPPPVPPRCPNSISASSTASSQPPPVPPRSDSVINNRSTSPPHSATLPRRTCGPMKPMNINCSSDDEFVHLSTFDLTHINDSVPELPPKSRVLRAKRISHRDL